MDGHHEPPNKGGPGRGAAEIQVPGGGGAAENEGGPSGWVTENEGSTQQGERENKLEMGGH